MNADWIAERERLLRIEKAAAALVEDIRIFNEADPDGILAEIPHETWQSLVAALRGGEG